MKYTIYSPNTISKVPADVIVIGKDREWQECQRVTRCYFTTFDAFIEYVNADNAGHGIPMCSNELTKDASARGRFNVVRNMLRYKRLLYCDNFGDVKSSIQKMMSGYEYVDYGNPYVQPAIKSADPLVTVILPVYNRSDVVRKSIESILKQTYVNIELLIVDDHSDEDNYNALVKYAHGLNDSRVSVYRMNKNYGPYVCKNEMINRASGKYVTMQDSDDTSDPDRISEQVRVMSDEKIMACSVGTVRDSTKERYTYCLAAVMYRKSVFAEVGYFDAIKYGADSDFNARVRAYYAPGQIVTINKYMYFTTFGTDCLTSVVPQSSVGRNDYYASCLTYVTNVNNKKELFLPYPCDKRRFYTPAEMMVDVNGLACEKVSLNRHMPETPSFGAKPINPPDPHGKICVFNQFFGLGDIMFIEPIMRRYFKNGYRVVLPVLSKFLNLQPYFPYVEFVDKDTYEMDYENQKIVEDGNRIILPMRWSMEFLSGKLPDTMRNKYKMLGLDMEEWRTLKWLRHRYKEEHLKKELGITGQYNLINKNYHTFKNGVREIKMSNGLPNVEMKFIEGYTLLDWASVVENATNIHTVNTSIVYMVETLELAAKELHIYSRNVNGDDFVQVDYLLGKNWIKHK